MNDLLIDELFELMSRHKRPVDFINRNHCEECEEHFMELVDVSVTELSYKEVENPGWDPTCFLNDRGFLYYLPGMVRIVEQNPGWMTYLLSRLENKRDLLSNQEAQLIRKIMEGWKHKELEIWDRQDLDRVVEGFTENHTQPDDSE